MYFAYLGHYTTALMWPAFLGAMFWLLSGTHQVNSCLSFKCVHIQTMGMISLYSCLFAILFYFFIFVYPYFGCMTLLAYYELIFVSLSFKPSARSFCYLEYDVVR